MRKITSKILAVALAVGMLPISLLAIPAGAAAKDYDTAAEGELLYTADFNVDKLKGAWDGMKTITPSADGASVIIKPDSGKKGATEGKSPADLPGVTIAGKAYTVVFTVTAENADQEVGFLPDDWVGFIVTPGKNSYRFVDTKGSGGTDVVLDEGTYAGTGALTQTYAVEFKSEGADTSARIVSYKLFVLINGEWTLACSVSADDIAAAGFDWFYYYDENGKSIYEDDFSVRFYRNRKHRDANNNANMTVSDFKIYKGLAATNGQLESPSAPEEPEADEMHLLYEVNFSGDSVFKSPGGSWAGATVKTTPTSVIMSTHKDSSTKYRGSAWGADLQGYTVMGKTYTTVFTVSASDADETIGFLPDDWAGFLVTPGQNSYKFITTKNGSSGTEGSYEKTILSGTYAGTGALTQTYAVTFSISGTESNPSVDAYKLYVKMNGGWACVCSLTNEQMNESYFDWFYYDGGVYEQDFTMRFYRRYYVLNSNGNTTSSQDKTQNGTVTVSNVQLYDGAFGGSDVYCQINGDRSTIRVIGVLKLTEEELNNYTAFGFDISAEYNGKTYTGAVTTQNVYTSFIANGRTIKASDYGGTYFYITEIPDVDKAVASDVIFKVDGIAIYMNGSVEKIFASRSIEVAELPLEILPVFAGHSSTDLDTGDNCYMRNFGAVSKTEFESYCNEIAAKGFILYATKTVDGNVYNTYVNQRYVITTIYTKFNSYGKVLVEPRTSTSLAPRVEDNVYTSIEGCETTITQVGLLNDDLGQTYNGMCYVVRLADGSFVIVDGGFAIKGYEERIYNVLRKQAPDPENIVIAAWIITHAHDDHVDVFGNFFKAYADKVTVERFITNMPSDEQVANIWEPEWNYSEKTRALIATYFPDALVTKAHPGQEFYIRNAKIDILFTLDVYDKEVRDFNNSSVVFTLEAEGRKMIFLGDYDDKGDTIPKLYSAATLKSDIVQVAHHGLPENSSNAMCSIIAPKYAFWPIGAQVVKNGTIDVFAVADNKYLVDNCEIMLAEDNIYVMTLKENGEQIDKYDNLTAYLNS